MHDPTQVDRQGPDVGDQYRSAVFYFNDSQKDSAEEVKREVQKALPEPIATQITPASIFYPAEPYHQKFSERTGIGMCHVPYTPL
jgi:methionine-S-sulfoxide reductase